MRLKFKLAVWVRAAGPVWTLPELAQVALEALANSRREGSAFRAEWAEQRAAVAARRAPRRVRLWGVASAPRIAPCLRRRRPQRDVRAKVGLSVPLCLVEGVVAQLHVGTTERV